MTKEDRVLEWGEFDDLIAAYHMNHCPECNKLHNGLTSMVINDKLYMLLEFAVDHQVPTHVSVSPRQELAKWLKTHGKDKE